MPLKPCAKHGCPELVKKGYCPAHVNVTTSKISRRLFDQQRGSSTSRGYDADWRRLRLLMLRRDPICKICANKLSEVVDHIVPIAAGGARLDPANLQGLCKECHDRKTATQDSSFTTSNSKERSR